MPRNCTPHWRWKAIILIFNDFTFITVEYIIYFLNVYLLLSFMNSPRQLDLWKFPVPLYFFIWLILTVTTFSHTTGKFLTSISIQAYSKHLRVLFSRKKYLRVDILFFPFFTGYAWAKLWKRLGRHFQLYLGLMYLWILCWQWYHLQQLGPKLFCFLFSRRTEASQKPAWHTLFSMCT